MKRFLNVMVLAIVALFYFQGNAQKMMIMTAGEGPEPLIIEEIGVIVVEQEHKLTVMASLPGRPGGGEIQRTNIKKDDEILMINGKRVKSLDKLKEIYEKISVDGQVKLGLERDGKMFLASFKKEKIETEGKKHAVMRMDAGGAKNMQPWLETGFLLGEEDGKVKISNVISGVPTSIELKGIQKGDYIEEINNTKIKTVKQFFELFGALKTGNNVDMVFLHGGKRIKKSFKKPESMGKMVIQRK